MNEYRNVAEIQEVWNLIFKSSDPFGIPFVETIQSYCLFYRTEGYYLTHLQYECVVRASQSLGESEILISETEWAEGFAAASHWRGRASFEEYISLPIPLENSLYSVNGAWGVLISHEEHAIIGGSQPFIDALKLSYPHWKTDCQSLQRDWSSKPHWVDEIVSLVLK